MLDYLERGEGYRFRDKNSYLFKRTFSIKNAPAFENFEKDFMKKIKGAGKSLIHIDLYLSKDNADYVVSIPIIEVESDLIHIRRNTSMEIHYIYDKQTRKCTDILYIWPHDIMAYSG